ncbi:MAG: peptide-methionine (S)-S-oxide reductase, partial [Candidatus Eremiobacteraeota bacterium]|nr:peptide-methionine (S)-S-oxide reductase [Candidatus Eremiobacteraeota bacterium]
VYFSVAHDPTELDRQGPDDGSQYRSVIFYSNDAQKHVAERTIADLTRAKSFASPIVTKVVPLRGFFPAEAYHQHFAERNPNYPYIVYNDAPKIVDLHKRFPQLVRTAN